MINCRDNIPLWKKIEGGKAADDVLKLILDLQTTNSPIFADLATEFLKRNHGKEDAFNQKIRDRRSLEPEKFSRCDLLFKLFTHMQKGKFVFHTGGWGVGEVMDISLLREHVLLEFEGTAAIKDLSFENAFKNLTPIPSDHFLARRDFWVIPILSKKKEKKILYTIIRLLLRDLVLKLPKRSRKSLLNLSSQKRNGQNGGKRHERRLKKIPLFSSPIPLRSPLSLLLEEVPHEQRVKEVLKNAKGVDAQIFVIYNSIRDFPEITKNQELKASIKQHLLEGLSFDETVPDLAWLEKFKSRFCYKIFFLKNFQRLQST